MTMNEKTINNNAAAGNRGIEDMKYVVAVSSRTGNTKALAERIREVLPKETCLYFGVPGEEAVRASEQAELVFVGFWTDKGNADEETLKFAAQLEQKKVFLFGTAGFGLSSDYFDRILERVKASLPESCTVAGSFMCQGKMMAAVKEKYEALQKQQPEEPKYAQLLANFEAAASHPDEADLSALERAIRAAIREK